MKQYDEKLVNDYIEGNDIIGYDIEDLENDPNFMKSVMLKTRDKNFYYLCSDTVKKDYEVVQFIINTFKKDKAFICEVADNYFSTVEDQLCRLELLIIMCNLIKDSNTKKYDQYKKCLETIFFAKRVEFELYKQNNQKDDEVQAIIGMGFLLIFDSYHSSSLVVDFFAKRMLDAIFDEYDIHLEELLHKQFKKAENIDEIGINNYLIHFITQYDEALASYLSSHTDLLSDMDEKVNKIKSNWDSYLKNIEKVKYEIILDFVHDYMEYKGKSCSLTEMEMLYLIGKQLHIDKKISEYDSIDEVGYAEIMEEIELFTKSKMNFNDLKHYEYLKKAMISILGGNVLNDFEENDGGKKVPCKIIEFKK